MYERAVLTVHRTVFRELLQNAADASASRVTIKFETVPSSTVPLPQSATPSSLVKHTILHHTLKRLVVTNDGQPFGINDWSRLKRIAEGNPDETKIGAFGVGFYSVFSDCEEPFVSSGKEAMAFYWKGNSLFTRKVQLPESQSSSDTTFVLDYRNNSTTVPPLLSLSQFLASSLTFVGLSYIELWLDDWRLASFKKLTAPGQEVSIPRSLDTKTAEGFIKIQSVMHETAQLDATWLNVVGWKPKGAASANSASGSKDAASTQSLRKFFSRFAASSSNAERAAREEREAQEAISEDLMMEKRATVFFHVRTAKIATNVPKGFVTELERATKKPPPKNTKLAVLTAAFEGNEAAESTKNSDLRATNVFASVLPSKSGRIFIGFPTHQTTGLAAHVSAPSVIPTVERESIDLNARWVRSWNEEMLRAVGIVCRIAWSGEIDMIKDELARMLKAAGRGKTTEDDIAKVTPQAIHVMKEFSFKESTPSGQVGSLVEEAFWTCDKHASIDILSSRGVLPSQHVRLATDELSFVEGIPVVPAALSKSAPDFVKKLVDYGIIVDVTTADIKKELENQALNSKQLAEFLQWLVHKQRIDDIDTPAARSLLSVTVANDEKNSNVIYLGQVKYFTNPSRIPTGLPVPSTTIPFEFIKGFDKPSLEKLGWEDLQLVPWIKFLLERQPSRGPEHDFENNPAFASQVLPVISKQWDGLSQSSKSTLLNLLGSRTVMPTKLGMRKPADAYFPSVKLFEDLPTVTVSAVKDKLLVSLGVRKTVDLNLVFERLLNAKEPEKGGPAWSHVELIKYLASVRNDIPRADITKLQNTPICSAESDPKGQLYRVTDLFEPKDELRPLGLKVLHWPGVYRSGSEEGRFLRVLGLRTHPLATELIAVASSAINNADLQMRDRALRYLVDFHHQHGYTATEIGASSISFLPVEGDEKASATPSTCFTNEQVALMGYKVLRQNLHPHAFKLGVSANPPIRECVTWLIQNPPKSHRSARQLFGYMATRLNELNGQPAQMLSEANLVPIGSSQENEKSGSSTRLLPPAMCFLGTGGRYADVFDYVDFGDAANAFLIRCGSKPEPSTHELARLVVREPARVFTTFNSTEKYIGLLTTLAQSWSALKKDKSLAQNMRLAPFLLASTELPSASKSSENGAPEDLDFNDDEQGVVKSWQLAPARNIVVVDDVINYNLFRRNVLAAPQEEELEAFYLSLGAGTLSENVIEMERIGPHIRDQAPAVRLKRLAVERIQLLFHDTAKDQIKRDASWIEKNLHFVAVSSLQVQKTLKSQAAQHTLETSAIRANHPQLGSTIYFKPNASDLFNVSQALLPVALYRPKPQQALVLTFLLESDLSKIRARGYDVSRILKRRKAEARIAEEERRKRLEEEQRRMQEAGSKYERHDASSEESQPAMPGVFPDTPENDGRIGRLPFEDPGIQQQQQSFLHTLGKSLTDRVNQARGRFLDMPQAPQLPQSASNASQNSLVRQPTPSVPTGLNPSTVTNNEHLQQNLLNAIKASRPHNSRDMVSQTEFHNVQETQTFCDSRPGRNISHIGQASSGMKIFLSNTIANKQNYMAANAGGFDFFSSIILIVADAMGIPRHSLHLFYDKVSDSDSIAFNGNGALFFNYRFFESLHFPDVQQGKAADAIVYWFVVACHELAHNIVKDHSSAHSYYT